MGIEIRFTVWGVPGNRCVLLLFPEGRTYSPPRRHKLHIPRPAASGRSRSLRCASSPHKVCDFAGSPIGGGIPPIGRARALFPKRPQDASPEGADNAANRHCLCRRSYSYPLLFCFVQQNDCSRFGISPAACLQKPATGSFIAVMGMPGQSPSSFAKRSKKQKRKDGECKWRFIT